MMHGGNLKVRRRVFDVTAKGAQRYSYYRTLNREKKNKKNTYQALGRRFSNLKYKPKIGCYLPYFDPHMHFTSEAMMI
jgi:hypothetical protein